MQTSQDRRGFLWFRFGVGEVSGSNGSVREACSRTDSVSNIARGSKVQRPSPSSTPWNNCLCCLIFVPFILITKAIPASFVLLLENCLMWMFPNMLSYSYGCVSSCGYGSIGHGSQTFTIALYVLLCSSPYSKAFSSGSNHLLFANCLVQQGTSSHSGRILSNSP